MDKRLLFDNSIKNFFKNWIYVFIPMGIIYLIAALTVFFFATNEVGDAVSTFKSVVALIEESVDASSASLADFMEHAMGQINWDGNFFDTLAQILDSNWLTSTVKGFFETLGASAEGFEEELGAIVDAFMTRLTARISLAFVTMILAVLLANAVTRYALRRRTSKRSLRQTIIAHTLVPLAHAAIVIGSVLLLGLLKWIAIACYILMIIIAAMSELLNSWLIHRDKNLKLKEVMTARNVFMQLFVASYILIFDVLLAIEFALINGVIAVFLMTPVAIYSLNIIESNTDSYVCALINAKKGTGARGEMFFEPAMQGVEL